LERISIPASSPDAKRAFTFAEAAAYLGGTSWAVRRLVWAGRLPYVKVGKRFTIPREALDNFIDTNLETNGIPKLKRAA
jgi:excisionase family DNA binding protein